MSSKKFLVLGGGGREHAMVWHLLQSGYSVECAPGSDAISEIVPVWSFENFEELRTKAMERGVREIIVGPEKFLAEGVADFFRGSSIEIFGPDRSGSRLESSKAWSKEFCIRHSIPTARAHTIKDKAQLEETLDSYSEPYVIKASGLAAGKGVLVSGSKQEALKFAEDCLDSHHSVLIEEFLDGQELSCFYMVEGEQYCFLGCAQDHKRLLDQDKGPNTGGMGSFGPPDFATPELLQKIESEVLVPSLNGLKSDGIFYRGFIFLGMMVNQQKLNLLEYNCRMGDPETQSVLLRLKTPLPKILSSLSTKTKIEPEFHDGKSMNIVVAASGYPGAPARGFAIDGLKPLPDDSYLFHAGTRKENETWLATGGRLFSIACLRQSLKQCKEDLYPWVKSLEPKDQLIFRNDIGAKEGA